MFVWPFAPTQDDGQGATQLPLRSVQGPERSRDHRQSYVQLWKNQCLGAKTHQHMVAKVRSRLGESPGCA